MDNYTRDIPQEQAQDCTVHKLPRAGCLDVHQQYGLWIISCRRAQSPKVEFHPYLRYFEFYTISHMLDGKGFYESVEPVESKTFERGQGVLMVPGFKHYYGGGKTPFVEDTIRFAGPVADQLAATGIITPGVINIGQHRRLLNVMDLADDPSVYSQVKANLALQNLLVDLFFENQSTESRDKTSRYTWLFNMIKSEPKRWWTVRELAEMFDLSVNHFRNQFKEETGMTPKNYIDSVKIKKAGEELCRTDRLIAEIAADFGYGDPYHFSRRFKQIMGMSPDHYRKLHSQH